MVDNEATYIVIGSSFRTIYISSSIRTQTKYHETQWWFIIIIVIVQETF